jgi:hypothetical protein
LFGLVHRTTGRQAEVIEELRVKRANDAYPKTSNAPPWVIHALNIANEGGKFGLYRQAAKQLLSLERTNLYLLNGSRIW